MPENGIFKISGNFVQKKSALENIISQLYELYQRQIFKKIVILSGGGRLANFVRLLDKTLEIGPDLSHWMAILAMNTNGELISQFSNLHATSDINEIKQVERIFSVFLPYSFLKRKDELPHNWEVTSDSIALYLSREMEFYECYLIKEVNGILLKDGELKRNLTTYDYERLEKEKKLLEIQNELKGSKPIDRYLPRIIDKFKIPCVILNGYKRNIINFFNPGITQDTNKVFTKLNPR
jgi:aspartokinase-like uncharacterized kinase